MVPSFATHTILEKAAVDNGFSLDEGTMGDWLIWKAHAAPARLCLTVMESGYGIGSDHFGAMRDLDAPIGDAFHGPAWIRRRAGCEQRHAQRRCWGDLAPCPQPARRTAAPISEASSRATRRNRGGAASQGTHRPGCVPRGVDGVLGRSLRGHWSLPPPAPARQPHRPLGGLRNRCRAFERPQRPPSLPPTWMRPSMRI